MYTDLSENWQVFFLDNECRSVIYKFEKRFEELFLYPAVVKILSFRCVALLYCSSSVDRRLSTVVPNAQVSDTTDDDICTKAGNKIILLPYQNNSAFPVHITANCFGSYLIYISSNGLKCSFRCAIPTGRSIICMKY